RKTIAEAEEEAPRRAAQALPIGPASAFSRHVIDLSHLSPGRSDGPRPDLDLEQKVSALAHSMRSAIGTPADDHRAFKPRRGLRAPLSGFLKLPFFLIALPFKTAPRTASKHAVRTPLRASAERAPSNATSPVPRAANASRAPLIRTMP